MMFGSVMVMVIVTVWNGGCGFSVVDRKDEREKTHIYVSLFLSTFVRHIRSLASLLGVRTQFVGSISADGFCGWREHKGYATTTTTEKSIFV